MRLTWRTLYLAHLLEHSGHLLSPPEWWETLDILGARLGIKAAAGMTTKSRTASPDTGGGRWITIGGRESKDGKRRGGSPVYIHDGKIVKGAPSLTDKRLDNLKGPAEETSRRKENQQSRDYSRARWSKRAKEAGIHPKHLDQLASDLIAHDAAHVTQRKRLLADARKQLERSGYHPGALTANLRSGRVEDKIPHLDELIDSMQRRYPEQFAGHEDPESRMLDLLTEGNPQPMSEDEAFEKAYEHLADQHQSGEDDDDAPSGNIFDEDDEGEEDSPWSSFSAKCLAPRYDPPLSRAELATLASYRAGRAHLQREGGAITRKSITLAPPSTTKRPTITYKCTPAGCWFEICDGAACRVVKDEFTLKWLKCEFAGV